MRAWIEPDEVDPQLTAYATLDEFDENGNFIKGYGWTMKPLKWRIEFDNMEDLHNIMQSIHDGGDWEWMNDKQ
jgi:hypothetical protein